MPENWNVPNFVCRSFLVLLLVLYVKKKKKRKKEKISFTYLRNRPNSPRSCSFVSGGSSDCCSSWRRWPRYRSGHSRGWWRSRTTCWCPRRRGNPGRPPLRNRRWSDSSSRWPRSRSDSRSPRWSAGSARSYVTDCDRDREMSPSGSIRSVTRTIYDDANIGGVHPRKTVRAVEGARALAHPHTTAPRTLS